MQVTEPGPFFGAQPAVEHAGELDPSERIDGSGEYHAYGHIVDLSGAESEPEAVQPNPSGFIKDPLRRSEASQPQRAGGPAPIRTQHVTVTLSRAELKQGGAVRVVLDFRVEGGGQTKV